MSGYALASSSVLLVFCGLLRPLVRGPWTEPRLPGRRKRPTEPVPVPVRSLNAIELALVAELSLEQARAQDEVANDTAQRPETRWRAADAAAAWRARAQWFQAQARRQAQHPMAPGPLPMQSAYAGPERRQQARRRETRRTGPDAYGIDCSDRRAGRDRRRGDRRRPQLVAR